MLRGESIARGKSLRSGMPEGATMAPVFRAKLLPPSLAADSSLQASRRPPPCRREPRRLSLAATSRVGELHCELRAATCPLLPRAVWATPGCCEPRRRAPSRALQATCTPPPRAARAQPGRYEPRAHRRASPCSASCSCSILAAAWLPRDLLLGQNDKRNKKAPAFH